MPHVIVSTTTATEQEAASLARSLVDAKLAGCVHIQPVRSVYRWKAEILDEPEWHLAIKTTAQRYKAVEAHIREHHSYETPEIVCIAIVRGSPEYLGWLDENVG